MSLPLAAGHIGADPHAPREKDLPRAVPLDGGDLASLDDAKIL